MGQGPYSINLELLSNHKESLIKLSKITEEDIRDVWIQPGDGDIDLQTLKHRHDLPLCYKMVIRFRNSFVNPAVMWNSLDPHNQHKLTSKYFQDTTSNAYDIMTFFVWVACSLGLHELKELTEIDDNSLLDKAQHDCIGLFFELSESIQQKFVNEYNEKMKDTTKYL